MSDILDHDGSDTCIVLQGTERQIHCLAVHPSRPHVAATGSSCGTVAVWDLRFQTRPAQHALPDASAGDVWQVSGRLVALTPWRLASRLVLMMCPQLLVHIRFDWQDAS
jgi:WD40 repeat protein